ncbi:MAG TPA: hypothetical protein VFH38_09385 [Jatrophihabitans sp.]|nr:hypothetical protein [Jatrophihabitans sp.]
MRLLVATRRTNGTRAWDVYTCTDGELVRPNVCARFDECARCDRLFAGATSGGVTSTATLADVPISAAELADVVRSYTVPGLDDDTIAEFVDDLLWPARQPGLTLGCVVTRTLDGGLAKRNAS